MEITDMTEQLKVSRNVPFQQKLLKTIFNMCPYGFRKRQARALFNNNDDRIVEAAIDAFAAIRKAEFYTNSRAFLNILNKSKSDMLSLKCNSIFLDANPITPVKNANDSKVEFYLDIDYQNTLLTFFTGQNHLATSKEGYPHVVSIDADEVEMLTVYGRNHSSELNIILHLEDDLDHYRHATSLKQVREVTFQLSDYEADFLYSVVIPGLFKERYQNATVGDADVEKELEADEFRYHIKF